MNPNSDISPHSSFVFVLVVICSKGRDFATNEPLDCSNTLKPVHAYKFAIKITHPPRMIEIDISPGFSASNKVFNVCNLLMFIPNVTALKIWAKLES